MNIKSKSSRIRVLGLILTIGCLASWNTFADTTLWNSASGGLWDSENWDNGVPEAGDTVKIDNAGAKTITIDDTVATGSLTINDLTVGYNSALRSQNTLHLLSGTTNTPLKITATTGYGLTIIGMGDNGAGALILDGRDIDVKDSAVQIGSSSNTDTKVYINEGKITTKDLRVTGTNTTHADLFVTGGEVDVSDPLGWGLRVAATENADATLTVTGGIVNIRSAVIGATGVNFTAAKAKVLVTGSNSILQLSSNIGVYSRAAGNEGLPGGLGTGELSIEDGAVLQLTGIYTSIGTTGANSIARIKNAVISYKDVGVDIDPEYKNLIPRITLEGSNALRLDNSKNRTKNTDGNISYTDYFIGGNSGQVYQGLQLTGANPKWNGTTLTIDDKGSFLAFDSTNARMGAALTNDGLLKVTHATAIFEKNVTLGASATLQGTSGELQFYQNLSIGMTARGTSNLTSLDFRFTNGINHTLDIGGSIFEDEGTEPVGNFMQLRSLIIDQGDSLSLLGTAGTNALYIGLLDLDGRDIGDGLNASLINALNLSDGVNIYYDSTLLGNAYLGALDYDLWGDSGKLIAAIPLIPEPYTLHAVLVFLAVSLLAWRKRRSA